MSSAIYKGWVRHRRQRPKTHDFRYRLFMLLLDLDEVEKVGRLGRWFGCDSAAPMSFRRRDHWGDPSRSLKDCVLDLVQRETGRRPGGSVQLLTQPRCWGYCFNPISVFYCFAAGADGDLEAVVAEVTNTPWGERHCYVIPASTGAASGWFDKALHVSPFMPMDQRYRWRGRAPGKSLAVHLENHDPEGRILDATLSLQRRPMTDANLRSVVLQYPFVTAKTVLAIHWEALRIWIKGIPIHLHPQRRHGALEEPQ